MRALVAVLVFASITVGGSALLSATAQPPWSRGGRGHSCEIKCGAGYCVVDLTPQNKNDCRFACEPC